MAVWRSLEAVSSAWAGDSDIKDDTITAVPVSHTRLDVNNDVLLGHGSGRQSDSRSIGINQGEGEEQKLIWGLEREK